MQKQKRDKRGRYSHKTHYWERVGQCLLLVGSIWAVNVIEFRNLEPVKIVITGSSDPLISTQEAPEQVFESEVVSLVSSQPKTIEAKIRAAFPEDPKTALAIAKAESGLIPTRPSNTDITRDGKPYSIGIFQINLTVSNLAGVPCNEAFSGRNNNSIVVDDELYKKCVALASDPDINIECAKGKFKGRGNWTAWGAHNNNSYRSFLD